MTGTVDLEIAWGGYYTSPEPSGSWTLFRLLDFNVDAYHAALFQERFDVAPTVEQAMALRPFIGHAPIAAAQLLHEPATLIGSSPLGPDDLVGYGYYLEDAAGLDDATRAEFLQRLIDYSQAEPLRLQVRVGANGSLEVLNH